MALSRDDYENVYDNSDNQRDTAASWMALPYQQYFLSALRSTCSFMGMGSAICTLVQS